MYILFLAACTKNKLAPAYERITYFKYNSPVNTEMKNVYSETNILAELCGEQPKEVFRKDAKLF